MNMSGRNENDDSSERIASTRDYIHPSVSSIDADSVATVFADSLLAESIIRNRMTYNRNEGNVSSSLSSDAISSGEFGISVSELTSPFDESSIVTTSLVDKSESLSTSTTVKETNYVTALVWSPTSTPLPRVDESVVRTETPQQKPLSIEPTSLAYQTSSETTISSHDHTVTDIEDPIPEQSPLPLVALPVPVQTEPVEAVPLPELNKRLKSARRIKILIYIVITLFVIAVGVMIGTCASGACRRTTSENSSSNDIATTSEREKNIINYINSITFTVYPSVEDNESPNPELQALRWLIDVDPLQLTATNDTFRLTQRYALLCFWFHSRNDDWFNSTGWLDYDDECSWVGISCTNIDYGSTIGVQNTVTGIDFFNNNIHGIIPNDLLLLSKLSFLDLSYNLMSGVLPESIGQWSDMKHLEVQNNGEMSGKIPESVGDMNQLENVDLSFNKFTGQIPSSIGNCSNLLSVNFGSNPLNGTLPATIGMWSKVEFVNLDAESIVGNVSLFGSLPDSVVNWVNIKYFHISGNNLSGSLPSSLSAWTNLTDIDVTFNEFRGTIPKEFANWTSIQRMILYYNDFTGTIPNEFCSTLNFTDLEADCSEVVCSCCTLCV